MKAFELLEKTPNNLNTFKKVQNQYETQDYLFNLDTFEELDFYKTLVEEWDDKQFLLYDNEDKAFSLFVTRNEEQKVEYRYYYLDVLWKGKNGATEYDLIDVEYLSAQSFREAVNEFMDILKKQQ